ncbi:MAG TPA: hypothetical protein PLY87_17715 [Planctomycetaceae bacterium]|nr:hypothetical protein [Planctomycetaceae bacterium]HQZ66935.1 hypothetical protein [Planctomycetaceae bacterium]
MSDNAHRAEEAVELCILDAVTRQQMLFETLLEDEGTAQAQRSWRECAEDLFMAGVRNTESRYRHAVFVLY